MFAHAVHEAVCVHEAVTSVACIYSHMSTKHCEYMMIISESARINVPWYTADFIFWYRLVPIITRLYHLSFNVMKLIFMIIET